ncbi:hypothetical protein VNI00_017286 [Paramarasmius palmivorus]|uniref:CxC2-like cysteine cluster KDZ transposase-associated domain-containing protein n=1 Tax=Paramarasmius palmivorus TaxID=297713 RepID=A0AAW0B7J4_9AGAR
MPKQPSRMRKTSEIKPAQLRHTTSTQHRLKKTTHTVDAIQPDPSTSSKLQPAYGSEEYPRTNELWQEEPETPEEEPGRLIIKKKDKAKRYQDSDAPILTWNEEHRDMYLDAILLTEGRGRMFNGLCSNPGCSSTSPAYRCLDCNVSAAPDSEQEWKDNFFHHVSLQNLGLRIQLGHPPGLICGNPQAAEREFVVISSTGIHVAYVMFCGCPSAKDHHIQLLEMGWWPSSYKSPRSAATFEVLRLFHVLSLQGHIPLTNFYRSLERMTDGGGLRKDIPDRLEQFRIMFREWRHIKVAKRAGRGHDPSGVKGTEKGNTTIPCRACPHPGINLPPDWEQVSPERQWLYALLLSMDANFKQRARARPNDARDVQLGPGWGCVVDWEEYSTLITARQHEDEISHCVGFSAIWNANNKKSKGLRATGIGAVICSRHELFRPNGIGDLQKGER